MPDTISIALAADERYAQCAGVAILSAIKSCARPLEVLMIDCGLSASSRATIAQLSLARPGARIQFIDPSATFAGHPELTSKQRGMLARLLLPTLAPSHERLIYLDSDVLVIGDLQELWDADLGGAVLAAARSLRSLEKHHVAHSRFAGFYPKTVAAAHNEAMRLARDAGGIPPLEYINSGVLLLDLSRIRSEIGAGQFGDLEAAAPRPLPDQDWIAKLCAGRIKYLDQKWNMYSTARRLNLWAFPQDERNRLKAAIDRPSIIHFVGSNPWDPPKNARHRIARKFNPWMRAWATIAAEVEDIVNG